MDLVSSEPNIRQCETDLPIEMLTGFQKTFRKDRFPGSYIACRKSNPGGLLAVQSQECAVSI